MTTLPEPLQPWAAALGLFPRDLALELGAWLPRLDMALGPLRGIAAEGTDEPDGFDGLARRGPYERLLPAEWLLADELPDEFNRRAASGEHAFFRLAFRAPKGHRRCLVLLDSGPSQLGTPRLAHLASLVVLERRAAEARAEFLWGVLQQPPGRFLTAVNESAVHHWLAARCAVEPTPLDLDGWREAFGRPKAGDELWLLGSRRLQRWAAASLLCVGEGPLALEVEVRPRGGTARGVALPLPSNEVCTRLIRDPLRREAPVSKGKRPATNLVFVAGGSRLLFGTRDGLLATHVIGSASEQATQPTVWHPPKGEKPVAVGWDRGLMLVTQQGTALRVCWFGKRGALRGQGAWYLHAPQSQLATTVSGVLGACVQTGTWGIVTSHGELVELTSNRTYAVRSTNVAGIALNRGRLLTVERQGYEASIECVPPMPGATVKFPAPGPAVERPADGPGVRVQLFPPVKAKVAGAFTDLAAEKGVVTVRGVRPESHVVFGYDNQAELQAMVGLQLTDGRWRVVRLRKNVDATDIVVPSGATVHGVACADPGDLPALVIVESDGRTLTLCTGRTLLRVLHASSRIQRVAVSQYSSHLAYASEDGLLCVFSLRRRQVVLRVQAEEEPASIDTDEWELEKS